MTGCTAQLPVGLPWIWLERFVGAQPLLSRWELAHGTEDWWPPIRIPLVLWGFKLPCQGKRRPKAVSTDYV
jgi:hypothetical protein